MHYRTATTASTTATQSDYVSRNCGRTLRLALCVTPLQVDLEEMPRRSLFLLESRARKIHIELVNVCDGRPLLWSEVGDLT